MIRKPGILFFLLFLLSALSSYGQEGKEDDLRLYLEEIERKYGNDANLVSGKKYFYPYGMAIGHPFLVQEGELADILIRGRLFTNQRIKYDIFNQQLVLEYPDISGSVGYLVLGMEWVESFRTATRRFIKATDPEGSQAYFQLVAEGEFDCMYLWTKLYQLDMSSSSQRYAFSEPRRSSFLRHGDTYFPYRKNRKFAKAFGKEHRKQVRSHLRQHKIKVQKASDYQMSQLMQHLNSSLYETD